MIAGKPSLTLTSFLEIRDDGWRACLEEVDDKTYPSVRAESTPKCYCKFVSFSEAEGNLVRMLIFKSLTCIVQDSTFCPIFYNHGKGPNALIAVDVSLYHSGVLKRQSIIDIHVTCYFQRRIPYLNNRDLGMGDTNNPFHSAYVPVSLGKPVLQDLMYVLFARKSANMHTLSSTLEGVVMQMSTLRWLVFVYNISEDI